jgi:hypothetical protein
MHNGTTGNKNEVGIQGLESAKNYKAGLGSPSYLYVPKSNQESSIYIACLLVFQYMTHEIQSCRPPRNPLPSFSKSPFVSFPYHTIVTMEVYSA